MVATLTERHREGDLPGNGRLRRHRIALYSPGMVGLGHMRRNLLIAQALSCSDCRLAILMIAEAREAAAFTTPPGVDCLTLPSIYKDADGNCRPRRLNLPIEDVVAVRENAIAGTLEAFKPDVLIVDHLPRGAFGELEPALKYLRSRGHTRCVLGLRDVLEDPETVKRRWSEDANEDAIRDYYDAVWVYGDPAVYDAVREYGFSPDVAAKMCYTGYFDQLTRLKLAERETTDPLSALGLPLGRLVLCLVGGGQDGARLAETFVQVNLPPGMIGVILTGPFMPREIQRRLAEHAAKQPCLRVLQFVPEPSILLNQADRVIAMGGYNSVCEVLSFEKPALIVPRVQRAPEQLIRAERFRDLGLLDVLHPDALNPQALTEWLNRDREPPTGVRDRINFNGVACLPRLLKELLSGPSSPARRQPPRRRIKHVAS